jgi:hypothetical protein
MVETAARLEAEIAAGLPRLDEGSAAEEAQAATSEDGFLVAVERTKHRLLRCLFALGGVPA